MHLKQLPYWPAALNVYEAASYVGLSLTEFERCCRVQPVIIPGAQTPERYLRLRLDEWLFGLEKGPHNLGTLGDNRSSDPSTFTPKMLAERWACSERHIRNLIASGNLPCIRLGGKLVRITSEVVIEYEGAGREERAAQRST